MTRVTMHIPCGSFIFFSYHSFLHRDATLLAYNLKDFVPESTEVEEILRVLSLSPESHVELLILRPSCQLHKQGSSFYSLL